MMCLQLAKNMIMFWSSYVVTQYCSYDVSSGKQFEFHVIFIIFKRIINCFLTYYVQCKCLEEMLLEIDRLITETPHRRCRSLFLLSIQLDYFAHRSPMMIFEWIYVICDLNVERYA